MPKAINCKKMIAFVLSSHSSSDHPHSPAHRSFSQMAAFTVVDKFIAEIFQTHKKTPFPSWRTTKERVKNC